MSFERILAAAEAAGAKDIGLTDHPYHPGLAKHHEALCRARERYGKGPVRVWIGAELEVVGIGKLIIPPDQLPQADYIIAAPSHYDLQHFPPVPHLDDPMEWADRLLTDMENVPGSGAHIIAHPFFVTAIMRPGEKGPRLPPIADIIAEMRPKRLDHLLDRIAEAKIALEISPRISVKPEFEAFIEDWYRRAKQRGIRFSTGSDSHRPLTVGKLGPAEKLIGRLELGPRDFWHASQVEKPKT